MSLSHFNETMTQEEIATEFRRSMTALEEYSDGPSQTQLDLIRLDKAIDRLSMIVLAEGLCIAAFAVGFLVHWLA